MHTLTAEHMPLPHTMPKANDAAVDHQLADPGTVKMLDGLTGPAPVELSLVCNRD
jgi:hypothetical protein